MMTRFNSGFDFTYY